MWDQLLRRAVAIGDVGIPSNSHHDGVFVYDSVPDKNVEKELIDAGRTHSQAHGIISVVLVEMEKVARYLVSLRTSISDSVSIGLNSSSGSDMYSISYQETVFTISKKHIQKILNLYKLHTDPEASLETPIFVSLPVLLCSI